MKKEYKNANRICLVTKTAKAKEETGVTVAPIKTVELSGRQVALEKLQDELEAMEEGDEITAEYLEFEEGESKRVLIRGTRKFKTKETAEQKSKILDAILVLHNGRNYIAAQSMLVSNLMDAAMRAETKDGQVGVMTPVQIEYLGKEKATVGHYDNFRITYLTPQLTK